MLLENLEWEEPENLLKPGREGLLPLLPLMKGAKQAHNEIIELAPSRRNPHAPNKRGNSCMPFLFRWIKSN